MNIYDVIFLICELCKKTNSKAPVQFRIKKFTRSSVLCSILARLKLLGFRDNCACLSKNLGDQYLPGSLYNKQLLDEAEYDMKNYADRGGCYPHTKAEFNNCFISQSKYFQNFEIIKM